ncbi:unnamed protein product, partial [Meganyctiphanes norvegica]
ELSTVPPVVGDASLHGLLQAPATTSQASRPGATLRPTRLIYSSPNIHTPTGHAWYTGQHSVTPNQCSRGLILQIRCRSTATQDGGGCWVLQSGGAPDAAAPSALLQECPIPGTAPDGILRRVTHR